MRGRCRGSAFVAARRLGSATTLPGAAGSRPIADIGRAARRCRADWPPSLGGGRRRASSAGSLGRPLNRAARLVLPRVQPRLRLRHERLYARSSAACCASASLVLVVYGGLLVPDLLRLHARRRPASSRRRTRATCWSTCSCPTRPRSSAPSEVMQQIEEIAGETPGVKHTVGHRRPVDPAERQRPELRRDVRDARRLPRPRDAGAVRRRDRRAAAGSARRTRSPTALDQRLRRAAGRGPGHGRRLQDRDRGPRRHRPRRAASTSPTRSSPTATTTPGLQGLFTSFRANTPWLYLDIDRDEGQDDGRVDRARSSTRCRSTSARSTSTTSTGSAAPGR